MEVKRILTDEVVDKLEFEKELYLKELQTLSDSRDELQIEINEMNDLVDNLVLQNRQLENDNRSVYRSFSSLQFAVSMLVFIYGMMYGFQLCPK